MIKALSIPNEKITIKRIQDKINRNISKMKSDAEDNRSKNELVEGWKDIMFELKLYTNKYFTYTLLNLEKQDYGYKCDVYATKGLSFEGLEKAKPCIETGIGCIFTFNVKKKDSKTAEAKFITEGFGKKNAHFVPPKTTPFELCIGNSVEGTPVIISSKDVSHFLLSGANGSGKSRLLDIIITTLIHNCNETELELYLAQIAKNDLVVYEDALCCRAFCETLNEVEIMLNHMIEKMAERTKLIKPMRKDFLGSDIYSYNKLHPNNKLSVCWIIFDEIASIMEKTGNGKGIGQQKDKIISMIEEIARIGRALGIFLGVCLQRCTANMLSPLVKSQTNLRISFSQNNMKSSEVAMDDAQIAIGLDDRVAVYSCRARGFDFLRTPYMDDQIIKKYVKPKSKRGHRNLFDDLEKLNAPPQILNSSPMDELSDAREKRDMGTAPAPSKPAKPLEAPKEEKPIIDPIKEEPSEEPEAINVEFKDVVVIKPRAVQKVKDYPPLEFNNVNVDRSTPSQKNLIRNIKLIPNFVPYEPTIPKIKDEE